MEAQENLETIKPEEYFAKITSIILHGISKTPDYFQGFLCSFLYISIQINSTLVILFESKIKYIAGTLLSVREGSETWRRLYSFNFIYHLRIKLSTPSK